MKDNPAQIEKNIEATIEEIVLKDLGADFFEQKLFNKDEQYLYFKSNIQLAFLYSTRALKIEDPKAKKSLMGMAEEQFNYATQYTHSKFMENTYLRELGMHHFRHKEPLKTIEYFEKMLKNLEDTGDDLAEKVMLASKGVYSNLGAAYYATGNYSMALDALRKATKSERNSEHVHFYMIRTLLKQGNPEEAFAYLDEVEKIYGPQDRTTVLRQAIEKHLAKQAADDDKPVDESR